MRVRDPLVAGIVQIAALRATRGVLHPVPAQRRNKRVEPATGQQPPRIPGRPVAPGAHFWAPAQAGTVHTVIVPGAGSRAPKSVPSACRSAISSVAIATKSPVSATV